MYRRQLVYLENAAESNEGVVRRAKTTGTDGDRRGKSSSVRSAVLNAASKEGGALSRRGKFKIVASNAERISRKAQKPAGANVGEADGAAAAAQKESWAEYAKRHMALARYQFLVFLLWLGLARLFPRLATLEEECKPASSPASSTPADSSTPSVSPKESPSGSISSATASPAPLGSIPEHREAPQDGGTVKANESAVAGEYVMPPRKFSVTSLRRRLIVAVASNGSTEGTTTNGGGNGLASTDGGVTAATTSDATAGSFSQSLSRQASLDEPDATDSEEEDSETDAPAEEYEEDPKFTRIENFILRNLSRLPPKWITRLRLRTVFRVPHKSASFESMERLRQLAAADGVEQPTGIAPASPLGLELVAAMKRRMQRNRWWRVRLVVSFVFLVLALLFLLLVLLDVVAHVLLYLFAALFGPGNAPAQFPQPAARPPIFGPRGAGAMDQSHFQCVNGDCSAGRAPLRLQRPFGPPPT